MEKIKSKLQKKLQSQGWKFLTHESLFAENHLTSIKKGVLRSILLRNDEEIKNDYLEKGFKNVRIENAYDHYGNRLLEYRAVYVRNKLNKD